MMKKQYLEPSITICELTLKDALLVSVVVVPTEPWEMEILSEEDMQDELDGLSGQP